MSRPAPTELAEPDATLKLGQEAVSPWSPLNEPIFRALWIATVVSNIGTWMEDVGESWLMVSLTTSPMLVALVETAGSLPVVLLALPAGALADVVDRRRLLLVTQSWMLSRRPCWESLTLAGMVTPWLLLLLTFILGLGSAMNGPALQAIIPELSASARALGGCYSGGRCRQRFTRGWPSSRRPSGRRCGIRNRLSARCSFVPGSDGCDLSLAAHSSTDHYATGTHLRSRPRGSPLRATCTGLLAAFVRARVFILCASALWALLPLQARHALGLGSFGYGILLGCIGAGAVAGAAFLPKVRQKVSNSLLVVGATLLFTIATAALAHVHVPVVAGAAMILGGIAWITVMSSFNTAAQAAAPAWARARVLSIYLLVFMGGMAVGSAVWGAVAAHFGVTNALTYAALGLMIGIAASLRYTLIDGDEFESGSLGALARTGRGL